MTRGEIAKVLAVLKAAYPRQEIRPETADVYASFLADLDFEAAFRAAQRHIATSQYFPAIAELRQAAAAHAVGAPAAELAWGEVMRQVRAVGRYRSPEFSHPAIAAAVDSVGWETVCNTEEDQLVGMRSHFYRTYNAHKDRALEAHAVAPLLSAPAPHPNGAAARLVDATAKQLAARTGGDQ